MPLPYMPFLMLWSSFGVAALYIQLQIERWLLQACFAF